eukprot:UC1_evm1s860
MDPGVSFKAPVNVPVVETKFDQLVWSSDVKGDRAVLTEGDAVATRSSSYNGAGVVTKSPLANVNGLRSCSIKMCEYGKGNWAGTMTLYLTNFEPSKPKPQPSASQTRAGAIVYTLSGRSLSGGSKSRNDMPRKGLGEFRAGQVLEIKIKRSGHVHFIFDNDDQGPMPTEFSPKDDIWVCVDIYGNTNSIRISGKALPHGTKGQISSMALG